MTPLLAFLILIIAGIIASMSFGTFTKKWWVSMILVAIVFIVFFQTSIIALFL